VFVDNGAAKKQVDPSQYATVHLGSAIQIRFRLEQTAPPPPTGMIGVVAAGDYSCSLGASGQLFCWGDANFNAQNLALTPFPLSNGDQFSALGGANGVAGHSCAIRTLGTAACWGSNNWGELGNGAMGGVSTFPTNVNGPAFATISSGSTHSCGVTPGGDAYCWGDNVNGQLGDGTTSPRLTPVPVAGGLKFKSIAAGGFYTCGVTTAGAGYCWGNVLDGRLGSLNWSVPQTTPLAVAGGLTFASISTGFYHTCGVTTTGAAYCWGYGFSGQLGNGTTSSNQPVPSAVSGGISFSDISTGRDHTCGITTAGGAYCWGQNIDGRLGNSSTAVAVTTPTAVTGGLTLTRISAGADHTCGVTNAGSVYCWGANNSGQVGDGTQTQRLFPVIVTFP
jgi:alpha-tubulin suppressor-like RCC1 family protein